MMVRHLSSLTRNERSLFHTRETVDGCTPASRATSFRVTATFLFLRDFTAYLSHQSGRGGAAPQAPRYPEVTGVCAHFALPARPPLDRQWAITLGSHSDRPGTKVMASKAIRYTVTKGR